MKYQSRVLSSDIILVLPESTYQNHRISPLCSRTDCAVYSVSAPLSAHVLTQDSVIPRTEDLQGVQPADVLLPVVMETATGLLGPGASGEGGPTTWVDTRDDRRSGCSNLGPQRALRVPPDRSCLGVPLHDQEPPSPLAPCPGVPGRSRIGPPLGMGRPHSPYSAAESPGSVVGATCLPNQ